MARYARLNDGVVVETISVDGDISNFLHPTLASACVEAPDGVVEGWSYTDGVFVQPVIAPPTQADLMNYAANRRWQIETGGITVGGVAIDTSRDSQAMITGAYAYSQAHPEEPIKFKAASGWVTLDEPTMAAIATAVGAHVQASFAVEEAVDAAVSAGTITSFAEIDAAAWPANGGEA